MNALEKYLSKQISLPQLIEKLPKKNLKFSVIIPVYDEPYLSATLNHLLNCDLPKEPVEIILVFNASEATPNHIINQNRKTCAEIEEWSKSQTLPMDIHPIIKEDIPLEYMGAGYARKLGMDEAIRRFASINRTDGVLISLDADTECERNYFTSIEHTLIKEPNINAGTIFFEHPTEGTKYSENVYQAIIRYELFLRYYKQALHYCGFPYAFHTIGSAFFVKALAYAKQGGMNKRKAGEDFYFLNKLFQLGNIREITKTRVYPSPRPSDRVLFGTGPEIKKISNNSEQEYLTYHPEFFTHLKSFFSKAEQLYHIPENKINGVFADLPAFFREFLLKINAEKNIKRIRNNCASLDIFRKHLFLWFDGLKIIRLNHEAHESAFNKTSLLKAANIMLEKSGYKNLQANNYSEVLMNYKEIELANPYKI